MMDKNDKRSSKLKKHYSFYYECNCRFYNEILSKKA